MESEKTRREVTVEASAFLIHVYTDKTHLHREKHKANVRGKK
jgi:hypothetical protein